MSAGNPNRRSLFRKLCHSHGKSWNSNQASRHLLKFWRFRDILISFATMAVSNVIKNVNIGLWGLYLCTILKFCRCPHFNINSPRAVESLIPQLNWWSLASHPYNMLHMLFFSIMNKQQYFNNLADRAPRWAPLFSGHKFDTL